jgi:predicted unusual protein kinase regulating ubiquinone biosynthesis (AarF/ABC1/UbiB family)
VPENLILLGRSLSILSGICSGLDPNFNIWTNVMPYARKLIDAESGGSGRNLIVEEALNVLRALVALPGRTDALLQRIEQGRLEVQVPEMKGLSYRLERRLHRLSSAIIFAALFISGVQLYLAGAMTLAWGCFAAALLALLWMLGGR